MPNGKSRAKASVQYRDRRVFVSLRRDAAGRGTGLCVARRTELHGVRKACSGAQQRFFSIRHILPVYHEDRWSLEIGSAIAVPGRQFAYANQANWHCKWRGLLRLRPASRQLAFQPLANLVDMRPSRPGETLGRGFEFSLWIFVVLFALLPVRWGLLNRREMRRRPRHLYKNCGSDLRTTADAKGPLLAHCPKCGDEAYGSTPKR